jgi:hypothetical protein
VLDQCSTAVIAVVIAALGQQWEPATPPHDVVVMVM